MAITRIEIPAIWHATVSSPNSYHDWSTTTVNNPLTPDTEIFSWSATSLRYGAMLGFDYDLIRKALQSSKSYPKLLFKVNIDYNANQWIAFHYHTLTNAPEPHSNVNFSLLIYTLAEFPETPGWYEVDLSGLRSYFRNGQANGLVILADLQFEGTQPSIIIEGEWEPNAPTLISPVGGVKQNRTQPIPLVWQHNGLFPQSGFELRYRKKGTSSWTTVSQTTQTTSYTIPGHTLDIAEYEWQVRTQMTYEGNTVVGPWSAIEVFYAAGITNQPVITFPTPGTVMPTQNLTVEWAHVPGQTHYEIQLLENGQVVRSVIQNSSNNQVTLSGWLENNKSYIVRVRIVTNIGIWSDWTEVNISVSFTPPARPIIHFVEEKELSAIKLYIENPSPTGTQPDVVSQDLYRRKRGGQWVKIAAELEPNAQFIDYTPASNVIYEYRAIARGDNDVSTTGNIYSFSIEVEYAILQNANNPEEYIRLEIIRDRTNNRNFNATLKKFVGRKRPVAEFSETLENNLTLEFLISHEEYEKLIQQLERQETLLYRDSKRRKIYCIVPSASIKDEVSGRYSATMTLNEVDYTEGVVE